MAKQSIPYPLRVYDSELWKRILLKAKENHRSVNAEIEFALRQYAPAPVDKKVRKQLSKIN